MNKPFVVYVTECPKGSCGNTSEAHNCVAFCYSDPFRLTQKVGDLLNEGQRIILLESYDTQEEADSAGFKMIDELERKKKYE